jgi:hypothetical protein
MKLKNKTINKTQYNCLYQKIEKDIFKTKPTPKFDDVLNYYESYRAKCNNKLKNMRLKKIKIINLNYLIIHLFL